MNQFFAIEGTFFRIMCKLADLMILNLLWVSCSLPLFTIGAATTALYKITMEIADNRESYIVRSYYKAFIHNFRRNTMSWLLFLSAQAFLAVSMVQVVSHNSGIQDILVVMLFIGEVILLFIYLFVVPLQADGEADRLWTVWKQAVFLGIAALPWSAVLLAGTGVLAYLTWHYMILAVPIWLIIGIAGITYIRSHIFNHIIGKYGALLSALFPKKNSKV